MKSCKNFKNIYLIYESDGIRLLYRKVLTRQGKNEGYCFYMILQTSFNHYLSIFLFLTEIPVASPTAVYTSYEEPSGEQILISADFSTNHPLTLLVLHKPLYT